MSAATVVLTSPITIHAVNTITTRDADFHHPCPMICNEHGKCGCGVGSVVNNSDGGAFTKRYGNDFQQGKDGNDIDSRYMGADSLEE
ncbi:hypothetical protein ACLMJK_003250 [Lecanora helva]